MLISVVMPVYNGEIYLQEAIDSILTQTYREFEFIIINDGSTDRTAQIVNDIQDSRVQVIHSQNNRGSATALNTGIQKAKGQWIAIQDADDISLPSRLEEQMTFVKAHPEAVTVGALKECISGKEQIPPKRLRREEFGNHLLSPDHLKHYRFYINPLCHGSVMFSKKAYEKAGGYDPSYKVCYDYDLWMRMFTVGEIHKIDEVLYRYRVHSESLSQRKQSYNEDWVVATNYIKKIVTGSIKDKRDPVFIVFGNIEACEEFKTISKINDLEVFTYIHHVDTETAGNVHRLFAENIIDGVILLEGIQYLSTFQALEDHGMQINQNLFKIWAGYWN